MTPLPDAARFHIAHPAYKGKCFTEEEVREFYDAWQLKGDVMLAPANTSDWRPLHKAFPDWPSRLPVPVPVPSLSLPADSAPEPAQEPPFGPRPHYLSAWATVLALLATIMLAGGLASCDSRVGGTSSWSADAVLVMKIAAGLGLLAIALGIAGASAARQEAILAGLNWMIAQRDAAKPKTDDLAPPE